MLPKVTIARFPFLDIGWIFTDCKGRLYFQKHLSAHRGEGGGVFLQRRSAVKGVCLHGDLPLGFCLQEGGLPPRGGLGKGRDLPNPRHTSQWKFINILSKNITFFKLYKTSLDLRTVSPQVKHSPGSSEMHHFLSHTTRRQSKKYGRILFSDSMEISQLALLTPTLARLDFYNGSFSLD